MPYSKGIYYDGTTTEWDNLILILGTVTVVIVFIILSFLKSKGII